MGTNPDVIIRNERRFLIGVAAMMSIAAAIFLLRPPEISSVPMPADARGLAERIVKHPSDWRAASGLSEAALDSRIDARLALWRAAYGHASMLAPESPDPPNGFARGAFFHWAELSPGDQSAALAAFGPLLRDPNIFGRMAKPVFEITGDLVTLRRWHPPTQDATGMLIWLALPNGFFADYRQLRAEMQRERIADFNALRRTAAPAELIAHFPEPPYHAGAEPLIKALLDELHLHPLTENPNRPQVIDGLIDYALRHDLEPLDGLIVITRETGAASLDTRMRLAQHLGITNLAEQLAMEANDPRLPPASVSAWHGECQSDVCERAWRDIEAAHAVSLRIETVQTDNVPAYIEIYADDVLRAEGEAGANRDFIIPVGNSGMHRIEVVLANPMTRNLYQRRIHIAKITTL
jgi:hypothetical protein